MHLADLLLDFLNDYQDINIVVFVSASQKIYSCYLDSYETGSILIFFEYLFRIKIGP